MKRESERVFFLAAVVDFLLFLQHTRLLLRSIYYTRDYIPGVLITYLVCYIVRTRIKSSNGGDSFNKLLENDPRGKGEYGE